MGDYAEHGYDRAEGKIIRTTVKAVLFRENEKFGGEEYWIPRAHLHDESEVWKLGDEGMLVVTEWLAIKKGWIGMNEKQDLKEVPVKAPDATSPTEALVDAVKPTELDNASMRRRLAATKSMQSGVEEKGDK